jgi:hypothetical protein
MDAKTKKKLEEAGLRAGDVQDFLKLTDAEAEFIEMKLALARDLRARRLARHLGVARKDVAKAMAGTPQPAT